ncbi:MAG: hypothetical protein AABX38_03150 [Candidatus Micrarchaeota archaeon]
MADSSEIRILDPQIRFTLLLERLTYLNEKMLPLNLENELAHLTDRTRKLMYMNSAREKEIEIGKLEKYLVNFTNRVKDFNERVNEVTLRIKGKDSVGKFVVKDKETLKDKYFSFITKLPTREELRVILRNRGKIQFTNMQKIN